MAFWKTSLSPIKIY